MDTIGERIAKFRKEKRMTQEEFSTLLGVSAQSVSKWENSTTMPDIMLLPVIADIFEISIDALFGKTPNKTDTLSFGEIPEAAFDSLLTTMQRAWNGMESDENKNHTTKENVCETKKYLDENHNCQTAHSERLLNTWS